MSKLFNCLTSVFLCSIILLSTITTSARQRQAEGNAFTGWGTTKDPYLIDTVDDLYCLADLVNQGQESYAAAAYLLTSDLELSSDQSWPVIGTNVHAFRGVFDGGNHHIKHVYLDITDRRTATYGLFASNLGTIKNLLLRDLDISVHVPPVEEYSTDGQVNVGGLVGYNRGTISNVSVDGSVRLTNDSLLKGISSVAGIAGHNEGIMNKVHNSAEITFHSNAAAGEQAVGHVGGVCAVNEPGGLIEYSSNSGSIRNYSGTSFASSAGGITGRNRGKIEYAANLASVSNFGDWGSAGGIDGFCENGSLLDSYNIGAISGSFAGGLIAIGMDARLTRSYNAGSVAGTRAEAALIATAYYLPVNITKSYYLEGTGEILGLDESLIPNLLEADVLSHDELQAADALTHFDMKMDWRIPPHGLNKGYPTHRVLLDGELATLPDKVAFRYGEELDLSGALLRYRLGYMEERIVAIDPSMVSGYDSHYLAEQNISVKDEIIDDNFIIRVHDYPHALHLKQAPEQLRYEQGTELNLSGGELELIMASGLRSNPGLNLDMVSGYDAYTIGRQSLTITHEALTCTFDVDVYALEPTGETSTVVEMSERETTTVSVSESEMTEVETTTALVSEAVMTVIESDVEPRDSESEATSRPSSTVIETDAAALPATGRDADHPFIAWPLIIAGLAGIIFLMINRSSVENE